MQLHFSVARAKASKILLHIINSGVADSNSIRISPEHCYSQYLFTEKEKIISLMPPFENGGILRL